MKYKSMKKIKGCILILDIVLIAVICCMLVGVITNNGKATSKVTDEEILNTLQFGNEDEPITNKAD